METIDISPTWYAVARWYLALRADRRGCSQNAADKMREELRRLGDEMKQALRDHTLARSDKMKDAAEQKILWLASAADDRRKV